MIPDSIVNLLKATLGDSWKLSRARDGWAETAFVAERHGRRVFVKTSVLVLVLRRLAELEIVPPLVASGEFDGLSFVIQEFVEAPYPEMQWFGDHLDELASLIRSYQQDLLLGSLLTARKLIYLTEDFGWVEQCYRALIEVYGEHAPLQTAYRSLLEQLPEVRRVIPVPTHGDLSRKNLLPTRDRIYLVDWDQASLSDPMRDVGTLLWWYVPPARWPEFFRAYGSPLGDGVTERAYWWAARTSLEVAHGLLEHGYLSRATDFVIDFLAAVDRQDNPHARYRRSIVGSPEGVSRIGRGSCDA